MAPLSDVVLISVVCAVTVFLSVLLVTVLCLRYRRKNILHSNGPNSDLYPQSRGIFHSPFHFPQVGMRQWSAISSTENIHGHTSPDITELPPCHVAERRFSRMSTLSTRNSRRLQKKSSRNIPLEPLASPRSCASPSCVEIMDSIPSHIAELRADCTPKMKQPPPHDDNADEDAGGRISSWPPATRKGSYYDITATMRGGQDPKLAQRRSDGILGQVPGSPPRHEVPPLPALRPPGAPRMTRHDSMLLSNKSLDTAGSSILDDPPGDNLNDSVDLEAASDSTLASHERCSSAGGWWLRTSTRSGLVSPIPQTSSSGPYSAASSRSNQLSEERGSPRRSASVMYYPERSSQIWEVQPPTASFRQLNVPPCGVSRSLTSGPWIPRNIRGQMSQRPPIYELNSCSRAECDRSSGQGQPSSTILMPVTENGKNRGNRPLSNANERPSKRAHGSSSSLGSNFAKASIDEQKKGHQRRKSVRLSTIILHPISASLSPTIEEPEDSSCKSSPPATTVTPIRQDKEIAELPSTTEASHQNPFDRSEQNLGNDEYGESTPTPTERGPATNMLSLTGPSSVPKSSPAPINERPNIPRRSSLRRNSSTSIRSQHHAQFEPRCSPPAAPAALATTPTGQQYASTKSTPSTPSALTTATNSLSGFPGLESYANIIAKMDNEARNRTSGDRPARNAFALRENSPLMEPETEELSATKSRPLPILPLPKLSQPPSRSRPPKFRAALSTINSVSNIPIDDDSDRDDRDGCGSNGEENDGGIIIACGKSDAGTPTPTPPSPSPQHQQLGNGGVAGSSIQQQEITATPTDKQDKIPAWRLDSTPFKAGWTGAGGAETLTSSIVRTPGSMYDQFGFLKE
ncbi:hypothetical protein ACJ72_02069 [Emergomyces africanus]|uniref:Uncharacterized protein n=1 Tax=Emergomyces africanus TaxID=1955775 RepID=A0A1B7P3V9_9EURO|nr:hypothetical protein ACJ72_02069 [Emergomyces africanus]